MAQKRMFSLSVVDTDKFLEMPISSRLLYYELGMRADDDGFVSNWKKILMFTGLKEDDMKVLIAKQFVIPFESGVIVIRHWRLNNYLQNDRTKPTIYQEELSKLTKDENNVYNLYTECIHSIDKNSIDKNSIDKNSIEEYRREEKETASADIKNKLQEEFVCCIGSTNLNAILECISYLDDLPFEVIQIALKKTADVNGNWKYAKAILNKWVKEKIDTVEKVKTEELNFKKGKQPTGETEEEKKERMIKELEVEFGSGN